MGELFRRARHAGASLAVLGAGFCLTGCVPLPAYNMPGVSGRVLDATSGKPVAGAVVVVRYDARYDDLLPDRDVIGHREVVSTADGSFSLRRSAAPGLAFWPLVRTETRVVAVIAPGYRCALPQLASGEAMTLALAPAADEDDRRDACRPLSTRAGETPRFHAAWQALHPRSEAARARDQERDLERVLAARRSFGFGDNCRGPVVDMALSTDGRWVAWRTEVGPGSRVEIRSTTEGLAAPDPIDVSGGSRRLAWTSQGDLVMWEPANEIDRALSPSQLSASGDGPELLWRGGRGTGVTPASPDRRSALPLEPSDLRDEGDARWLGRSFRLTRSLDPATGLARDSLRVSALGRETRAIELPGEACGPHGEYGEPQLRIAADTRTALDLRDVGEGCGVFAIDLDSGVWRRLERARGRVCAEERSVPVGHLRTAARGFATEVEEALAKAGADPQAAWSLRIAPDGGVTATSVDYTGALVRVAAPQFPIRTPLRRIEFGVMGQPMLNSSGGRAGGSTSVPPPAQPALEPL
jgi:hypothetical protein